MLRYGSGEVITVPRHTSTAAVTSLITASSWSPHPSLTPLMPWIRPVAAAIRRSPLRRALDLAAPSGDSPEDRERDRRTARFVIAAVAHGEDGSMGCGLVEGEDFYGLTAAILARAAIELASSSGKAGALPPADGRGSDGSVGLARRSRRPLEGGVSEGEARGAARMARIFVALLVRRPGDTGDGRGRGRDRGSRLAPDAYGEVAFALAAAALLGVLVDVGLSVFWSAT